MPRKRQLNLQRYGMSEQRYSELKLFCFQYPKWEKALKNTHRLSEDALSDYLQKVGYIQEALEKAIATDQYIYGEMLRSITMGIKYDDLNIPVARTVFFQIRTAFFVNLDRIIS